jgi:hypothetical protein
VRETVGRTQRKSGQSRGKVEPLKVKMKQKPPSEFDTFTKLVDRVLSVPHAEIQRREQEYRRQVAQNPKRRGPKRKLKTSASHGTADL